MEIAGRAAAGRTGNPSASEQPEGSAGLRCQVDGETQRVSPVGDHDWGSPQIAPVSASLVVKS